jgi:hypothetical protein
MFKLKKNLWAVCGRHQSVDGLAPGMIIFVRNIALIFVSSMTTRLGLVIVKMSLIFKLFI